MEYFQKIVRGVSREVWRNLHGELAAKPEMRLCDSDFVTLSTSNTYRAENIGIPMYINTNYIIL